jgi:hypothetical protein
VFSSAEKRFQTVRLSLGRCRRKLSCVLRAERCQVRSSCHRRRRGKLRTRTRYADDRQSGVFGEACCRQVANCRSAEMCSRSHLSLNMNLNTHSLAPMYARASSERTVAAPPPPPSGGYRKFSSINNRSFRHGRSASRYLVCRQRCLAAAHRGDPHRIITGDPWRRLQRLTRLLPLPAWNDVQNREANTARWSSQIQRLQVVGGGSADRLAPMRTVDRRHCCHVVRSLMTTNKPIENTESEVPNMARL